MQHGSGGVQILAAVEDVSEQRVVQVLKVHPDLVGASRPETAVHQGANLQLPDKGERRARGTSPLRDRHALAVNGMPTDGRPAFLRRNGSMADGQVPLDGCPGRKLLAEPHVNGIGFSNDQAAAGSLVQTMDDARPDFSPDCAKRAFPPEQRVHEGA